MVVICYECKQLCTRDGRVRKVYGKLLGRDGDVAERARWLTLTRIPGSVWPIVSLL